MLTGQAVAIRVMVLLAGASFGGYLVPPRLVAARAGAIEQVEQAQASWIGQKCVTKYAIPLRSDGKIVDNDAVFRIYTATRIDRDLVKIESGNVSGWVRACDLVLLSEAIEFYTAEIKSKPAKHEAYHRRGLIWESISEYDKAIADFSEAIRLDPKQTNAFHNRGYAWQAKGDLDKAIADFTEAIRLEPKNAGAFHSRGFAWSAKKDYTKAIADYNEAIRLDPKDAEAFSNRGYARQLTGQIEKAIADYSEAIRLEPDARQVVQQPWPLLVRPETLRQGDCRL